MPVHACPSACNILPYLRKTYPQTLRTAHVYSLTVFCGLCCLTYRGMPGFRVGELVSVSGIDCELFHAKTSYSSCASSYP